MAVIKSELSTESGSLEWPGPDQRRYMARYEVETDSANDGYLAVLNGAASASPDPVPAYGTAYALFGESDNGAFLLDFKVRRAVEQTAFNWIIETIYRRRRPGDPKPGEFSLRPTQRTTDYWVEFAGKTIPLERGQLVTDLTGAPAAVPTGSAVTSFFNSIGDVFDEPPTEKKAVPVVVARHYFSSYGAILDVGRTYHQTINDAAVTWGGKSYPARTLKLDDIRSGPSETDDQGGEYWEAFFLFLNDPNNFKFSLVNQGYRWWDAGQQKKRTDDPLTHEEINFPRLLLLDGALTPQNTLGISIEYQEDRLADYSQLPFN